MFGSVQSCSLLQLILSICSKAITWPWENDSELAAAKISSQADELELGIVRADIFPEIKLEAYSQRINKFSSAPVPVEKNSVGSITVSQPLWQQTLGTALELAGQQSELAKLHYEKGSSRSFCKGRQCLFRSARGTRYV